MHSFMLNNSLAATSTLFKNESIFAADGKECNVKELDGCGDYLQSHCTARAYSRLRYNEEATVFTAMGCGCSNRVYCIDECFNELGYTQINNPERRACDNMMTDVSLTFSEGERFFVASFEKSAFLFDACGNPLQKVCQADNNESIIGFIPLGVEKYAFAVRKNGLTVITVADRCRSQSVTVDNSASLRMLFKSGNTVFGLFGYSYIYNRIVPIYTNGILTVENYCTSC